MSAAKRQGMRRIRLALALLVGASILPSIAVADDEPPVITIHSPRDGDVVVPPLIVSGSAADPDGIGGGATLRFTNAISMMPSYSGSATFGGASCPKERSFNFAVPTTALIPGQYLLTVAAHDCEGNSGVSETVAFVYV